MTEQKSGSPGLLQVQYAFLELPKLPPNKPEIGGAPYWAWLFVHATELTEIPPELAEGPYREALELAIQAKFTQEEMQTYEKVRDEIRQVFEIASARWAEGRAEGKAEGRAEGKAEGETSGRITSLLAVLNARGLSISADALAQIEACKDADTLDRWIKRAVVGNSLADIIER